MSGDYDYGEDGAKGPTDSQLKTISGRAQRALHLELVLIPEAEAALAALNREHKQLCEVDIPNAMTEAATASFELATNDGTWIVAAAEQVVASIPKDRTEEAHGWLEGHKHGDLIKHVITLKFGKGIEQLKLFRKFRADLAKRKVFIPHDVVEKVEYQTLGAWVREMRSSAAEEGCDPDQAVPVDLFGIFKIRTTKFSRPKKQKVV